MAAKTVERTALSDFRFDDRLVKAGMVVKVPNAKRMSDLVAAGVVAATDEENDTVPKLAAPQLAAHEAQERLRIAEAGAVAHSPSTTGVSQHGAELLSLAAQADAARRAEEERERQVQIRARADADAARLRAVGQVESARKLAADTQGEADAAKAKGDVDLAAKLQGEADTAKHLADEAQAALDALPPATAAGA